MSDLDSITLGALEDEEVVRRCQAEIPYVTVAYEELMRRFQPVIFGTCFRILGNQEDAQEATQDVLLQMFSKIHQFEGRSKFNTWLFPLVNRIALRRRSQISKKREKEKDWAFKQEYERRVQEQNGERQETDGYVMEILDSMPERDREVLLLKFASDLDFQEISEALHLSLSGAKMRYYRALESFRSLIEEYGKTPESDLPLNE